MHKSMPTVLWRHTLLTTIVALIAALAIAMSSASPAHAVRDPSIVSSNHTGWVKVRDQKRACPAIYPTPAYCSRPVSVAAWRWTGSFWSANPLYGGTWVYASPYSGAWHWVWTQYTGWLAIRTSHLDTGYTCVSLTCPRF